MKKEVKNASQLPRRFFGLHMAEGVAEYPEHRQEGSPVPRLLLTENTLKRMDSSFEGQPVYVGHQDVNIEELEKADGFVVRSFYNSHDGKHWAEFLVVSDKGHEAISKGWKLSNSYQIEDSQGGGKWHAVDYTQEVVNAKYKHLAIVPNPRYEESIILTPEQFREYNSRKEQELKLLTNSKKQEKKPMFKLFKRQPIENAIDVESTVVTLSNGKDKTIAEIINEAEEMIKKEKENEGKPEYANGDSMVKVGEKEMSVNELVEQYKNMLGKKEEDKPENEGDKEEDKPENEGKKEDKPENEGDKKEKDEIEEKRNAYFNALKKAENSALDSGPIKIETSQDKLSRGKSRYGSAK